MVGGRDLKGRIYYLKVRWFVLVALRVGLGKLKSSDHKLAAEGSPKVSTQQKAALQLEIQACGYLMDVSV